MYKYACGKSHPTSELNWPHSTSHAKLFTRRDEVFLLWKIERIYSAPEKVFTAESGSCCVNKTFKAWAFIQKDYVAYWRLSSRQTSPQKDYSWDGFWKALMLGRGTWEAGCLESRDSPFPKPLVPDAFSSPLL